MVFGSALGPVLMGWALDAEISLQTIACVSMIIAAICGLMAWLALRR
jgi:hypothetical protein